jgi:hypothetical protein
LSNLTHSPARVIRQLLVDINQAINPNNSSTSWQATAHNELDTPDNVITVGNTAGILQGDSQLTGEQYEAYGVQIRLRATDEDIGWAKAKAIVTALEGVNRRGVVVSDTPSVTYCVHGVIRSGGILATGYDVPASKRKLLFLNVLAQIEQQP